MKLKVAQVERQPSIYMSAYIAPFNQDEVVSIPNPEQFKEKLARFIEDGVSVMQVVADFDMTFSRYSIEGRRCYTTYSSLERQLGEEKKRLCAELSAYYGAIEADHSIPFDERFRLMEEWQHKSNEKICNPPFHKSVLNQALVNRDLVLRNGADSLISFAESQGIKFSIVSAGLGNLIQLSLHDLPGYSNLEVLSNFLHFDSNDFSTEFSEPFLHGLSKPQVLAHTPLRRNIVLLGDMPHDLLMVGSHDKAHVLSVGYFNDDERFNLADYTDKFDVIVSNDGNLQTAELILHWISGVPSSLEELPTLQPLLEHKPK